ncbi:hypothetical protein LEP1GSC036_2106 [Leptospira weilii str. 2006001853]|uniref:Uncharacterized protein n=1 Tax=Leptospira weilii str. 2006001853 TaxID=1001589 RepID=A0A828Z3I7_9LEPT|nr:hypothetical protein LEP1GSC036_2106 [Leptospira weilii str. 2006001853]
MNFLGKRQNGRAGEKFIETFGSQRCDFIRIRVCGMKQILLLWKLLRSDMEQIIQSFYTSYGLIFRSKF